MVEKAAGGANTTAVLEAFAAKLETQIDNGTYSSEKASWVECADITAAVSLEPLGCRRTSPLTLRACTDIPKKAACALSWAQDANAFNCQYVLKTNETDQELSGAYYTGAAPIIELQLAKGGYRLAAWINALATAAAA